MPENKKETLSIDEEAHGCFVRFTSHTDWNDSLIHDSYVTHWMRLLFHTWLLRHTLIETTLTYMTLTSRTDWDDSLIHDSWMTHVLRLTSHTRGSHGIRMKAWCHTLNAKKKKAPPVIDEARASASLESRHTCDSSMCLIHVSHWYVVWVSTHDPFMSHVSKRQLFWISFMCVTWPSTHARSPADWESRHTHKRVMSHPTRDSSIFTTWLICLFFPRRGGFFLPKKKTKKESNAIMNAFMYEMWLFHTYVMAPWHVRHDSCPLLLELLKLSIPAFICETRLLEVYDMTHWHDSYLIFSGNIGIVLPSIHMRDSPTCVK